MLSGKDFFFCYNYKLNKHLQTKGFKYITHAINIDTNKKYFMYHKTNQLSAAINEYINNKP